MLHKRFFRFFLYLAISVAISSLLLLFGVTGLAYYIAVSDQEQVPELVEETCREQFGVKATFSHYRFQYYEYFPFLSLSLRDVSLRDPDTASVELLHVEELNVLFRPWKLLRRELVVKSFIADTIDIRMIRRADGSSNTDFLSRGRLGSDGTSPLYSKKSIQEFQINHLHFLLRDSLHGKHHDFVIRRSTFEFLEREGATEIRHRGTWQFNGLVFKPKNGPFLRNTAAEMDLHLALERDSEKVRLLPSTMNVDTNALAMQGVLELADTGRIRLEIASAGIRLETVRPWLANNLQQALAPYRLDEPVRTEIVIDGPLGRGMAQPIDLRFSARNANLATATLSFTEANLSGRYVNNCDSSGRITPHTDCLTFEQFSGKLFDRFPFQGAYHAQDLKNPMVSVTASASFSLGEAARYLPPEIRVWRGRATVRFDYRGRPEELLDPAVRRPTMTLSGEANLQNTSLTYLPSHSILSGFEADLTFDESNLTIERASGAVDGEPFQLSGRFRSFVPLVLDKPASLRTYLRVEAPPLHLDRYLQPSEKAGRRSRRRQSQTDALLAGEVGRIFGAIARRTHLKLVVNAPEVRYRKLRATQTRMTMRLLPDCENGGACLMIDEFAGRIYGNLPLQGTMQLTHFSDPRLAMQLQLAAPLRSFGRMLPRNLLTVGEGNLDLELNYRGKLDDYFELNRNLLRGELSGAVSLSGVSAAYLPAGYEARRLNARLQFDDKNLYFDSLSMVLNENALSATGQVTNLLPFLFSQKQQFSADFEVIGDTINLNHFPIADSLKKEKPRRASTPNRISGQFRRVVRGLSGELKLKAGQLRYHDFLLSELGLKGKYNDPGCDAAAGCITIEELVATTFGDLPLRATLKINDLSDPFVRGNMQLTLPLTKLNPVLPPEKLRFDTGHVDLVLAYAGQPHDQLDPEAALLKARLVGWGRLRDAGLTFLPRGYQFEKGRGVFTFDDQGVVIQELDFELNRNALQATGRIEGLLPFILKPDSQLLQARLRMRSPDFNLDHFSVPGRIAKPPASPDRQGEIEQLVESGLANISAEVEIDLDQVRYQQFTAHEVTGDLVMTSDSLHIKKAMMELADGQFVFDGRIDQLAKDSPRIDIRAKLRETDISKLFFAFGNFGQSDMTYHNIRGRLTGDVTFRARADNHYELMPASMSGAFDLQIDDGELIELPGLMNINNFLFKGRNLREVKFATLKNAFLLEGQTLRVNYFDVVSSAFTFGVEGQYCLGDTAQTDLLFQVPIRNLFRQELSEEALKNMAKSASGLSILVRATGDEDNKLNFKWVLSRKDFEKDRNGQ